VGYSWQKYGIKNLAQDHNMMPLLRDSFLHKYWANIRCVRVSEGTSEPSLCSHVLM
jgi:hypothetical protein